MLGKNRNISNSWNVTVFFLHLRKEKSEEDIISLLENYEISKLDISRIYRYLDKYSSFDMNTDDNESDNNSTCSCI